jgi:hypothetical protein
MASHNIIVVNVSGTDLFITGSYGSDLSNLTVGSAVPSGYATTVASWNAGSGPVDNWDYIYLGTQAGGANQYQLYMESNSSGKTYQFMGFYSDDPNNSNSNPYPFTNGACYVMGVDLNGYWVYTFLTHPS